MTASLNISNEHTGYYVDATRNDDNPGTEALPWQTITKVNATTIIPGDYVVVQGGVRHLWDSYYQLILGRLAIQSFMVLMGLGQPHHRWC